MSTKKSSIQNAEIVIERFGGIRPMASKINVPVTTVQGWKKRNVIPGTRRNDIEQAAQELNIDLSDVMSGAVVSEAPAKQEANENKNASKKTSKTQSKEKKKVSEEIIVPQKVSPQPAKQSKEELAAERQAQEKARKTVLKDDQLLKSIEEGNRKTIVTTIWIVTGLILLAAALMVFMLWPNAQKVNDRLQEQEQALSSLQEDVRGASEQEGEDFSLGIRQSITNLKTKAESELAAIQNQARNTQIALDQLKEKTAALSEGVIGAEAGPLSQRLSVIEEQIQGMEGMPNGNFGAVIDRIQKLEDSFSGQIQMQDSMAELKNIIGGLDGKVTSLQDELSAAQEGDTALGQTLQGVSGKDLQAAAMLIAFSQLRDSLNRQAPFEEDLALLNKMVAEDNVELRASLDKLAPHANKGILSTSGLSSEFRGLAGDIVTSSLKGEDVSVKDKAMARLNDVLKVEKNGELLTGTETQDAVNQAQAFLDQGDVQGAIAKLQTLDGEAAQTAKPFIDQAQASLLAGQVQKMLRNSILSKVGGQFGGVIDSLPQSVQQFVPAQNNVQQTTTEVPVQNEAQSPTQQVMDTAEQIIAPREVLKDDESGLTILPQQQGFKGLSTGQ
ncbi:MAG: mitofilin family membrane protein [Pseudomonadota bacterium]